MTTIRNDTLRDLVDQARQGTRVTPEGAARVLEIVSGDIAPLLAAAGEVRRHVFGNQVRMCSIVAGKLGGCGEDCAWCAQSCTADTEQGTHTQRTSPGDMLAAARHAAGQGAAGRMGIVNAGRRPTQRDLDDVIEATRLMTADPGCEMLPCASLGELTPDQARQLADAGVTRYHHNLETSRRLFAELVTTHSYDERIETLRAAKDAGMSLCCGGLFGLGEAWPDRLDLALTIRDQVAPDCVPVNFLNPIPGTRLADRPTLPADEGLAIIAMFRLIMPRTDIKVAGGRETCLGDQQYRMFQAGATSCMTGDYLTTMGQGTEADKAMVAEQGFQIVPELRPLS